MDINVNPITINDVASAAYQMISTTTYTNASYLENKIHSAAEKLFNPRVITKEDLMEVEDKLPTPYNVNPSTSYLPNFDVAHTKFMTRPDVNGPVIALQQRLREHLIQNENEDNLYNIVFLNAGIAHITKEMLDHICDDRNPGIVLNDNNDNQDLADLKRNKIEVFALNTLMQTLYDEFITLNSNKNIDVREIDKLDCEGLQYIFIEMIHPRKVGVLIEINKVLRANDQEELFEDEFNSINNFDSEKSVLNYFEASSASAEDIIRKLSILNAFLSTTSAGSTDEGLKAASLKENRRYANKRIKGQLKNNFEDLATKAMLQRREKAADSAATQKNKRQHNINERRVLAGGKTMKKHVRKSSRKQMKKYVRKSKKSMKKRTRK